MKRDGAYDTVSWVVFALLGALVGLASALGLSVLTGMPQ